MDVPAILNSPPSYSASSTADVSIGGVNKQTDRGFSQHFDENVDRLKGEQDLAVLFSISCLK
jgi:hypothetical protein